MAQNLCTNPAYGGNGLQQTLFLGCSISSFSVNVGFNEQQSVLTVLCAQDPCSADPSGPGKVYWDENLEMQTTYGGDLGWSCPNPGSAVFFRVNNGSSTNFNGAFEFAGIIQSWVQLNSFQGNPVYQCIITDPRNILAGVSIIIDDAAYGVGIVPNILNVYGFCEQFGDPAPLVEVFGTTFGSPGGGFGGSLSNDRGMSANIVFPAVSVLTSCLFPIVNQFSPYGRILFRDTVANFPGYGLIDGCGYLVDLSAMPTPPSTFRFAGTNISLLDAITQTCDAAGCDYYIELLPTIIDGTIYRIIKVNTVSRAIQPNLGEIANFIAQTPNVSESSAGLELRNEVTSAFVIGDNLQQIYQAYNNVPANGNDFDIICPYFGLDPLTGNIVEPSTDANGYWQFSVSAVGLNLLLNTPLNVDTVTITEYELLAAIGGYDVWYTDAWFNADTRPGSIFNAIQLTVKGIFNAKNIAGLMNLGFGPLNIAAMDFMKINAGAFQINAKNDADLQQIYSFVLTYAQEFYGLKFMVQLPYTAVKADPESAANGGFPQIETSDTPSDGGWTDYDTVLDLPHPSVATDFFTLEDNRLGCFAEYFQASGLSTWEMNPDDFGLVGENLYLKATTDPILVFVDAASFSYPRVVVTLSESISTKQLPPWIANAKSASAALSAILGTAGNTAQSIKAAAIANGGVGGAAISAYWPNKLMVPDAIAVPLKSNTLNYGPWYIVGPPGVTNCITDNTLNPWSYGSTDNMGAAGVTLALNNTANQMIMGEMGSISVPGYPIIPLGAELGAYYNGYYGAGTNLIENRSAIAGDFSDGSGTYQYLNGGNWQGLYGPNVTSINVEVGIQGVTTNYQMRTFTPQFGRFSRNNAELIREQGVNMLRAEKQFRHQQILQERLANIAKTQRRALKKQRPEGVGNVAHSPHDVLVGQTLVWNSGTRGVVCLEEAKEVGKELLCGFANKAFMSLDGLLRPVSISGDGGLPQFATAIGGQYVTGPAGSQPPLYNPATSASGYSTYITSSLLNPLASGHDVTVLGRNSTPPSGEDGDLNLYTSIGDGSLDYATDYRFMAYKGPMVLQSWGYDLDGKPVPNSADDSGNASMGIFTTGNLTDNFLPGFMNNSQTWPVSPVDLRFDRKRGVWVSPPSERLVLTTALQTISGNMTGICVIASGGPIFDSGGNLLTLNGTSSAPQINITNIYSGAISSGQRFLSYFEPNLNTYWPLAAPGNARNVHGIVTQTIPQSGSGTVNLYTRNAAITGEQFTGETIVCYDWWLSPGQVIPSGTHVFCNLDTTSNIFYVQQPWCGTN